MLMQLPLLSYAFRFSLSFVTYMMIAAMPAAFSAIYFIFFRHAAD